MELFLLTLSPFVVATISAIWKPAKNIDFGGYRKTVVRFIVGLLSFGAVLGTSIITGKEVDIVSIETFSQVLLTFLGATGTYFLSKKKK